MDAEITGLDRRQLVADAVVLQHRLPRIWTRIQAADVPVWQARRVASRTRTLTAGQAGHVDIRVAASLGQLSGKRLEHLLHAESCGLLRGLLPHSPPGGKAAHVGPPKSRRFDPPLRWCRARSRRRAD